MILESREHDTGNPHAKDKVNGKWTQVQPLTEHINSLIGNVLRDKESMITFRLVNYFLIFSEKNKRIHPDDKFMDSHEFVKYGGTNQNSIWLQHNRFSRESATYIQNNF